MHYQISRNGQTYGPYTLEDLQRYVASGNILLTDLAKSDSPEPSDWVAVSQILSQAQHQAPAQPASPFVPPAEPVPTTFAGQPAQAAQPAQPVFAPQPVYAPQPAYGQQPNYAAPYPPVNPALTASQYSDAPDLNWGLYLLFAIITCTLFSKIMTVIQAAWLQRVQPNSKALLSYGIQYGILILSLVVRTVTHTIVNISANYAGDPFAALRQQNPISSLLSFLYVIMIFVSRMVMRSALEEHFNTVEPVGLRLNPVMSFFFGGVYHQYHLNRINQMKQAARYGAQPVRF